MLQQSFILYISCYFGSLSSWHTAHFQVGLMESPLSDIIAACVPYLNGRQPQYLQQVTKKQDVEQY